MEVEKRDRYVPSLRYSWLTPLYDPVQRWIFRESVFKSHLVEQAHLKNGHKVLDLGCGTATLTIFIKKRHPAAEVFGLDGDPAALEIARLKAAKAGVEIAFEHGMASHLPYPDSSFDRVLSSLMFHHLNAEQKRDAMQEVFRVLRPAGQFYLADLGRPHTVLMYLISLVMRRLEHAADNIRGLLPGMIREAGFLQVTETATFAMPYGTVCFYTAHKPMVMRHRARRAETGKLEEEEYRQSIKRVFRTLAPFYDLATGILCRVRRRAVDFAKLRRHSMILDVATGTGEQALAFCRDGHEVTGIDLSEAMLEVADRKRRKKGSGNVTFHVSDATSLPFADESFDLSCIAFALHDMPPAVRRKALKEMIRVTRSNGRILIVDYALPRGKLARFLVYHFISLYEGKYYEGFAESDLAAMLREAGIEPKQELSVLLGAGRIVKGIKQSL
jgi:ubiquinone/menaquinone biosynthesis C-methylase UbiE